MREAWLAETNLGNIILLCGFD